MMYENRTMSVHHQKKKKKPGCTVVHPGAPNLTQPMHPMRTLVYTRIVWHGSSSVLCISSPCCGWLFFIWGPLYVLVPVLRPVSPFHGTGHKTDRGNGTGVFPTPCTGRGHHL